MKLESNYKKKIWKKHKHGRLNNMVLNNKWINEEIKEEIKKYQKLMMYYMLAN